MFYPDFGLCPAPLPRTVGAHMQLRPCMSTNRPGLSDVPDRPAARAGARARGCRWRSSTLWRRRGRLCQWCSRSGRGRWTAAPASATSRSIGMRCAALLWPRGPSAGARGRPGAVRRRGRRGRGVGAFFSDCARSVPPCAGGIPLGARVLLGAGTPWPRHGGGCVSRLQTVSLGGD